MEDGRQIIISMPQTSEPVRRIISRGQSELKIK